MEVDGKKVMEKIPNPRPYDVVKNVDDDKVVNVFRDDDRKDRRRMIQLHKYKADRVKYRVVREWYANDETVSGVTGYTFGNEVD